MSGQILTNAGSSPGHFLTDEDLCLGHFLIDEDFWMSLPQTVRKCPEFYKYKGFKAWRVGWVAGSTENKAKVSPTKVELEVGLRLAI